MTAPNPFQDSTPSQSGPRPAGPSGVAGAGVTSPPSTPSIPTEPKGSSAWRAVRELRNKPFFWNKTTHRPAQTTVNVETATGAG